MAATIEAGPTLPPGMIRIRHKDPYMAGERQGGPDGRTVAAFDPQREALVPDDSGFHLNPDIEVVEGEPRAFLVEREGGVAVQAPAGPMMILKAPVEHVGGQKVVAPDGTVIRFNASGFGMAPENAWGKGQPPPGYGFIEAASVESIAKWRVQAPETLKSLEDAALRLAISELPDEEEEDPYRALMLEMAAKPVVPTTPEVLQGLLNPELPSRTAVLGVPAQVAPPPGSIPTDEPEDLGLEDEYGEGEELDLEPDLDEAGRIIQTERVAPPAVQAVQKAIPPQAIPPRPNGRPKGSKDKKPRAARGKK